MSRENKIDWANVEEKRAYYRSYQAAKRAKLPKKEPRGEPVWHEPAYNDFLTGHYALKELHNKYGVSVTVISQYISKRMKANV